MASAARLAIPAWRNEPCIRLLRFRGIDLNGLDVRMQIRLAPNTPGDPQIDLPKVTSAGDQGLRLLGVSTDPDGVTVSEVQLNISKATMSSAVELPYSGEIDDDNRFSFALQISGQTRLFGEFVALATPMDSDAAPVNRSEGGRAGSGVPWSAASVTLGADIVEVTLSDAAALAPLAARAESAAERAEAAAEAIAAAPDVYLAGDSLVDGAGASGPDKTLAARLAYYLGGAFAALGVPGSYSGQAVDREVGVPLTLANNRLDSDGSTVIERFRGRPIIGVAGAPDVDGDFLPDWSSQPLTSPATGRVIERRFNVAGVSCVMRRTGTPAGGGQTMSEAYELVYPPFSGANVWVSATQLVARAESPAAAFYGLWTGTNDRYLPDTVVANVTRWFNAHAGRRRFVLTPLCQDSEPIGSTLGDRTRQIAARLGEVCGTYAIDALGSLLAHGLRAAGLVPNTSDYERAAQGVLPQRLLSDPLHLNDAGYDALAQVIVMAMVGWGWVKVGDLAHVPLLLS